jgi:hypothetical protein
VGGAASTPRSSSWWRHAAVGGSYVLIQCRALLRDAGALGPADKDVGGTSAPPARQGGGTALSLRRGGSMRLRLRRLVAGRTRRTLLRDAGVFACALGSPTCGGVPLWLAVAIALRCRLVARVLMLRRGSQTPQ